MYTKSKVKNEFRVVFKMQAIVEERNSGGSQAIRLRQNVRAKKDQQTKNNDALECIVKSLGEEEALNIKMTWNSLEKRAKH